jgi:hypothetical protein
MKGTKRYAKGSIAAFLAAPISNQMPDADQRSRRAQRIYWSDTPDYLIFLHPAVDRSEKS